MTTAPGSGAAERPPEQRNGNAGRGDSTRSAVLTGARSLAGSADPNGSSDPAVVVSVQLRIGAGPLAPPVARLVTLLEEIVADPAVPTATAAVTIGSARSANGIGAVGATAADDDAGPDVVRVDQDARSVFRGSREIGLTRREFDLLAYLATHENQVLTRSQLLAGAWGHLRTGHRSVDVHVRRLRAKLGTDLPVVSTIRGVGYRLDGGRCVLTARAR